MRYSLCNNSQLPKILSPQTDSVELSWDWQSVEVSTDSYSQFKRKEWFQMQNNIKSHMLSVGDSPLNKG